MDASQYSEFVISWLYLGYLRVRAAIRAMYGYSIIGNMGSAIICRILGVYTIIWAIYGCISHKNFGYFLSLSGIYKYVSI